MAYMHWFVSRQKRQLTTILQALVAYSDVCVGKVWNRELQLEFEDVLGGRDITEHGSLRARRAGQGGGGIRTLFKQMKDLGLVFLEDENKKCRLTLIGEELVKGNVSFVEAMRMQLQRYQYPSAAVWSGSGSVDHSIKIHPFQFMFRLLRDGRLKNTLSMEEMYGIVIHKAVSDSEAVFEDVVSRIIQYRQSFTDAFVNDTNTKTYSNIANTFFNYISLTQRRRLQTLPLILWSMFLTIRGWMKELLNGSLFKIILMEILMISSCLIRNLLIWEQRELGILRRLLVKYSERYST